LAIFVLTIALIIGLVFCAAPFLVQRIASMAEKRIGKANKPNAVALRYALKNICSLKLLHNISRLCALIVGVILTVCSIFVSVRGQMKNFEVMFNADYVIFNSTDACYGKAQDCESTENVYRAYVNQASLGIVISADDASVCADWLKFDDQPKGNEAFISSGIARSNDLGVGDSVCVTLGGVEYELVVSRIVSAGSNYIGINCEDMGIPYNMLLVQGKSDALRAELLSELSEATASELAPIAEVDTIFEQYLDAVDIYIDAVKILLIVLVVFSLIGITDVFYESLRARREEFELYRISGMTRQEVRTMKASELTVTVILGLAIGIFAFIITAFAVNLGMTARGMEFFLAIISLF
jgi:predicted lysophospholipase L1 biosynthesis ABC-type transport system permease subunit